MEFSVQMFHKKVLQSTKTDRILQRYVASKVETQKRTEIEIWGACPLGEGEGGFGSVHLSMQLPYPPDPDSLAGQRITVLVSVDLDDAGAETDLIWMNGVVLKISDRTWLLNERSRSRCHPVGEAAEISWDAVPEINYVAGTSIRPLIPKLWNKDKEGAWCKDLGVTDYGIKKAD